jgi:transcriptional regulator with XRE-family HTH domain
MSRIGEKIKILRAEKGLTQKQLAKKCGISESYIGEIESGKRVMNESMIKKISDIMGTNISESLFDEEVISNEVKEQNEKYDKKQETQKSPLPEWQSAFSSIIKDIPIYNIDMNEILEYKHLPLIDKKVEGYNPDKLIYISMPDNSLNGFRIKKGDIIMVILNSEPLSKGFFLIECDGKKSIRSIKRLDGNSMLLLSHDSELKTDTRDIRSIKIIGHCIKAEIDLNKI